MFPSALAAYAGAKFKLVRGYKGTADIILAMERGEVDIVGAYGLPGMLVSHPDWVNNGEAVILYQCSLKRSRLLPDSEALPRLVAVIGSRRDGDVNHSVLAAGPTIPLSSSAAVVTAI